MGLLFVGRNRLQATGRTRFAARCRRDPIIWWRAFVLVCLSLSALGGGSDRYQRRCCVPGTAIVGIAWAVGSSAGRWWRDGRATKRINADVLSLLASPEHCQGRDRQPDEWSHHRQTPFQCLFHILSTHFQRGIGVRLGPQSGGYHSESPVCVHTDFEPSCNVADS